MKKKRLIGISAVVCFLLAVAAFGWSLTNRPASRSLAADVQQCEQQIRKKQQTTQDIAQQCLAQQKITVADKDISVYYFVNENLQSWTTLDIPIAEKELLSIDTVSQFIELGQSWYVTHAWKKGNATVLTAILIKKGYSYDNVFLIPQISSFLFSSDIVDIVPVSANSKNTISSIDGKPLFTVVFKEGNAVLAIFVIRWLSVFLFIVGLFLTISYYNTFRVRLGAIGLLILLRFGLASGNALFETDTELFSSILYADSSAIPSLGCLLLYTLFGFFIIVIFLQQFKQSEKWATKNKRGLLIFGLILSGLFMACVQYVFRSLILNSTIPLDLSQLDQLTRYTFITYGVLALLYSTLYLLLYMNLGNLQGCFKKIKLQGYLLIFITAISLYTITNIEIGNHKREELRTKAWSDKLATEHDPTAELLLSEMANPITQDVVLKKALFDKEHADEIHRYLTQHYFNGYMQYYDLQITICPRETMLRMDTTEINCRDFFTKEIAQYGTCLNEQSVFYYLANDNGRNSYLAFLTYVDSLSNEIDLFLELDSKLRSGGDGYPDLLVERAVGNRIKMLADYSYAKYADGHLIAAGGEYHYPYDNNNYFTGDKVVKNGYSHLLFPQDARHLVVISRHTHTFWSLLVLFSYLFFIIGFGLVLLLITAGIPFTNPFSKNTFQRKITILLILAFVISILYVGVGTVWYNIRQFRKNALTQMEEKMRTVLTQLDYHLSNVNDIHQADEQVLNRALAQLSNSMHLDINVYDTMGQLLTSSRMEIFEKQLQSVRINKEAFEHLHAVQLSEFVNKENIGELTFYSLYATYYNLSGKAIVYVNVPYFSKRMEDIRDASAVITTMINVYILALFIALLIGTALANRMLRPLEIVRRNMQRLDVTKKMEYIRYDEKDELGDLIRAYNQMVTALEESTRQLAQSERESAWREMARQIAHEIKNPLTPMRLSIQHLMRLKKENAPDWIARFEGLATSLLEQIDTLAKTASEFSNFAKTSNDKVVSVSLNTLIEELRPLYDIHKHILFDWKFDAKEAVVNGHPDQLSRVLVNLLNNAVQALQDIPKGKIKITLSEHPNTYSISIEDNGSGVRSDLQKKLFTPNFTTKGSGTGLGLAISKNIVEQESGRIAYTASSLGGACFTVYLQK